MKFDMMKSHQVPQRVHMHLSDALGIIPRLGQFPGHRVGIAEFYPIHVPDPPVLFLGKAGVKRRPGRNTAGTGGIGVFEKRSVRRQGVQKRRFHVGMPCDSQAVPPHLIRHNEDDVWPFLIHTLLLYLMSRYFAGVIPSYFWKVLMKWDTLEYPVCLHTSAMLAFLFCSSLFASAILKRVRYSL